MTEPLDPRADNQPNSRNRLRFLDLYRRGLVTEQLEQEVERHELGDQTGHISEVVLNLPEVKPSGINPTEFGALDWQLSQEVIEAFDDRTITLAVPKPSSEVEIGALQEYLMTQRQQRFGHNSNVRFVFIEPGLAHVRWIRDLAIPNKNGYGLNYPEQYETSKYNRNVPVTESLQREVTVGGVKMPFALEGGNTIIHDGTIHISQYSIELNAKRLGKSIDETIRIMQEWFQQPVVIIDAFQKNPLFNRHLDLVYAPLKPNLVAVADLQPVTTALSDRYTSAHWSKTVRADTLKVVEAYNALLKGTNKLDEVRDKILAATSSLTMQYSDGSLDELGMAEQRYLDEIAAAAEKRGNTVIRVPYIPATEITPSVTYTNGLADNERFVVAKFGMADVSGERTLFDELDDIAYARFQDAGITPVGVKSAGLTHTSLGGSLRCRTIAFHEQ